MKKLDLTELIVHRVNTIEKLKEIPSTCGAEIDLRADGSRIVLNHDPFKGGERFDHWLEHYRHGTLVLNVKEAGIETEVLKLAEAAGIRKMFLLDVEFPYLYRAARSGERRIATRFSEDEPLSLALQYKSKVDWVWIDTNTRLPLDEGVVFALRDTRTCLVCPERWGRPQDIPAYRREMERLDFAPTAVMTSLQHLADWRA